MTTRIWECNDTLDTVLGNTPGGHHMTQHTAPTHITTVAKNPKTSKIYMYMKYSNIIIISLQAELAIEVEVER